MGNSIPTPQRPRYEFLYGTCMDCRLTNLLTDLSLGGWQLCAVVPDPRLGFSAYYMQRLLEPQPEIRK